MKPIVTFHNYANAPKTLALFIKCVYKATPAFQIMNYEKKNSYLGKYSTSCKVLPHENWAVSRGTLSDSS
jgi:hypothetical protein